MATSSHGVPLQLVHVQVLFYAENYVAILSTAPAASSVMRLMAAPGRCQFLYTSEQKRYMLTIARSSEVKCLLFLLIVARLIGGSDC